MNIHRAGELRTRHRAYTQSHSHRLGRAANALAFAGRLVEEFVPGRLVGTIRPKQARWNNFSQAGSLVNQKSTKNRSKNCFQIDPKRLPKRGRKSVDFESPRNRPQKKNEKKNGVGSAEWGALLEAEVISSRLATPEGCGEFNWLTPFRRPRRSPGTPRIPKF